MRRGSIIQKMTAVVAILVIFAGTQGFVISSHTCNSCGTHDETVSLFGTIEAENHDCMADEAGPCCQITAPLTDTPLSCCTETTPSCETVLGSVCCEYDTERVAVETFTPEKSARTDVQVQPLVAVTAYRVSLTPQPHTVTYDLHIKHGSGRDIVLLTCCLLI